MSRDTYTPEAVAACEKALITLLTKIGPWGAQLVLIGGMAPRYLVGPPPEQLPPHVGTTDLDVVIGVALSADDEAAYRTLQKNLVEAGFAPARDDADREVSFRWEREVDGIPVILEFFCPLGGGEPGSLRRNPGAGVGSRISAIRVRGADLAAQDHITVTLTGETLDGGGIRERVPVKVANILPFIVLKSFALDERDKDKDSYDLVWCITAYQDGPGSAADACARSGAAKSEAMTEAIEMLRKNFRSIDHSGPARYALFESAGAAGEQVMRLRRYAFGAVNEFLRRWDEVQPK